MLKLAGHILVVDDEPLNSDLLVRQLEKEGYSLTVAASGQEAIDIMSVEQFDLVLLDIMMPEVSGYDVLQFITSENRIKDCTSVIMTSAITDRDAITQCINMGAEDYLTKPFQMRIVKSRVWRSLYNRRNLVEHKKFAVQPSDAHILLIDDQEMNLEVLSKRLKRLGYKVSTVDNGRDAIKMMADVYYDLVLLDIMMPIMNGFDVLDKVRNNAELSNIPVIMVSALDDMDSVKKCIEKGANDYLVKPINSVLLKARIESCLATRTGLMQNTIGL